MNRARSFRSATEVTVGGTLGLAIGLGEIGTTLHV
jgi:hypothetical protein